MDKRYEINAYYDYNYRGLADSAETDDYEEMKEIVWDFIQQHCVEITDWKTGQTVRYSEPDDIYYDGEIDIDLDPFTESYRKITNKAGLNKMIKIKENYSSETMETISTLLGNLFFDLDRKTSGKRRNQVSDYSDDGYLEISDSLYQERKDLFDRYKRMFKKVLGTDKYIIDRNIGGLHIFGIDYDKMKTNESRNRKFSGRKRFYEGHTEDGYLGATKWVGDKSHLSLYGKDLSSAIRQDLKDNGISGCTVRTSRGNSVTVTVKGKDSDKISYNEFKNSDWYKDVFYYGYAYINGEKISERDFYNMSADEQDEIRYQAYEQDVLDKKEYQINHYYLDNYNTYFTNSFINKLKKINSILAEFQYDDSNAMVDYFNTNMYYSIYVVF